MPPVSPSPIAPFNPVLQPQQVQGIQPVILKPKNAPFDAPNSHIDGVKAVLEAVNAELKAESAAASSPAPVVPPVVPVAAAPVPEAEEPVKLSWNVVNEAERRLQQKRAAFKAEQEAHQKAKNEFEKMRQSTDNTSAEIARGLQTSPIKTLQGLGMSMDQLLQVAIAEHQGQLPQGNARALPEALPGAGNSIEALKKEVAGLREYIDSREQRASQERQLADFRASLTREVQKPENGLLSAFPGIEEMMLASAARYADMTEGQVLTSDKVARMMYSELGEHVLSLFSHPAVQAFLTAHKSGNSQAPASLPPAGPQSVATFGAPPTITQRLTAGAASAKSDEDSFSLEQLAAQIPGDFWGA